MYTYFITQHSNPRYLLKNNENVWTQKDLGINVRGNFIHNSLKWKQPKCPSKWNRKTNQSIHTTEYYIYSNKKINELWLHSSAWMDFKVLEQNIKSWKNIQCDSTYLRFKKRQN